MNNNLATLAGNPVFQKLTEEELLALEPIVDSVTFEEGDPVFCSGHHSAPRYMYVITGGRMVLHLFNNEFKIFKPGELIGEIGVING